VLSAVSVGYFYFQLKTWGSLMARMRATYQVTTGRKVILTHPRLFCVENHYMYGNITWNSQG
jgi:hypothetical protein